MARTDGLFYIRQSAYVSPVSDASIWLRGNDKYISFGSVAGASGYGFRDNGGVMQFKNSGGSWTNVGTGGGGSPGGSDLELQFNNAGSFGGMTGTAWDNSLTKITLTKTNNGTANTPTTSGFSLENKTAATVSQNQFSPAMRWVAQGWKTNATAGSQEVMFNAWLQTRNNGVHPIPQLIFAPTINGTTTAGGIAFASVLAGGGNNAGTYITGLDGSGNYGVNTSTGFSGFGPVNGGQSFSAWNNASQTFTFVPGGAGIAQNGFIGWGTGGVNTAAGLDTRLFRDAAHQLALRNDTNSQSFRVYKTFTDASNFERLEINGTSTSGWLQIIANSAGTGSANLGIALTPRGTGAISAQVPDSTSSGGNARGSNAVDFQTLRTVAARVASGTGTFVGSGSNNAATQLYSSVVCGANNQSTGSWAFVGGGVLNLAQTQYSCVVGGEKNTAVGFHSWIPGGKDAITRSLVGAYAYSAGQRAAQGDAQVIGQPVRQTTTDATPVSLATNGTPAATTVMVLPANSTLLATAIVTCQDDSGNSAAFRAEALFKRDGSNNTTRLGSATVTQIGTPDAAVSTATIDLVANNTLNSAEIQATGVAATTIHWVGELKCVQVL